MYFSQNKRKQCIASIATIPSQLFFMCILPILVFTIYQLLLKSQFDGLTFQIPQGNFLFIIAIFLLCAFVHEIGHLSFAKLTGADIRGFTVGFQFGIPFFSVDIQQNMLQRKQLRPIIYGGVTFNLLFAFLSLGIVWLLSYFLTPGISTELGVITSLNGQDVQNSSQFIKIVNSMKNEFHKERFIIDYDNQFQNSIQRDSKPTFGAISVKIHSTQDSQNTSLQYQGNDLLFLQIEQRIQGQVVKILKPILPHQETLSLLEKSFKNPSFCKSSSNKELCLLPAKNGTEVPFYVNITINGVNQVISTTFTQLQDLSLIEGGNGFKTALLIKNTALTFIFISQASLGIAAVSLLPFPSNSDGSKVIDEFDLLISKRLGLWSIVICSLYKGILLLLSISVLILLVNKSLGIIQ